MSDKVKLLPCEELSLTAAFDMGFEWAMCLRGQTMEDSRAVGRTLFSDTFTAIADRLNVDDFNSFESADHGIVAAKVIIHAALTRPPIGTDEVVERVARPKIVELFGHLNQAIVPLSEGPQLSKAAAERLRKMEQLDLHALMTACKFPVGASVTYHDEDGAHDPCYVVLPDGASLPLNHWNDEQTDVARAVLIVRACNAAIAAMKDAASD